MHGHEDQFPGFSDQPCPGSSGRYSHSDQRRGAGPQGCERICGATLQHAARGSGIIVGQFSGVDDSPFISDGDALVAIDRYRCFTTMSECKGWLYTMQSKYTNAGAATLARCIKR